MTQLIYSQVEMYYNQNQNGRSLSSISRETGVHTTTLKKYFQKYLDGDEMFFISTKMRVMAIAHRFEHLLLGQCVTEFEREYKVKITKRVMMNVLFELEIKYFKVQQQYQSIPESVINTLKLRALLGDYKNPTALANELGISRVSVVNMTEKWG